jgi:glucose/arabinose dehydrogenase
VRLASLLTLASCVPAVVACGTGGSSAPEAPDIATESGRAHHFDVRRIATGLNRPTFVGAAPGDDRALWVLEQPGRVVRLTAEGPRTVLDMTDRVRTGTEQGLLGMAFHPDFARNGLVYLHWSDPAGDTRVAEFRSDRDGRLAPREARVLLRADQPEENHNGGQLAFGPDGRLYLGLGDGGGAFDPRMTAQDRTSLLGKILSLDVDSRRARWRVELYGLRNPWRFSFDPALGEVWIGDVGQDEIEEVNRVKLEPDEPPKNLGWSVYEGGGPAEEDRPLRGNGELIWPVASYSHDDGCSITGGLVYGGSLIPGLNRRYVYGDFCSGTLWSLEGTPEGRARDVRREAARIPALTHIGTDARGELVFASGAGDVYRAVPP